MIHVGAHVSISGGVSTAPGRAMELGATALGMFTKNQRQWNAKPISPEEAETFKSELARSGIGVDQVIVHASYLINVGSPEDEKREKSLAALVDELRRAEQLGLKLVNFHPGSGMGELSEDQTLSRIADACSRALGETSEATLVLEATAGQGDHVGYTFRHLAEIIDRAGGSNRLGVCIDTCHIFAGGYDFRTDEQYRETIAELERTVGLDRLVGFHLNDSKTEHGSRKDRHHSLGAGLIGIPALARFITDDRFDGLPFVLETVDPDLWAAEIALTRQLADGSVSPEEAVAPSATEES
jgi:deoxyribonuclease IV